MYLKNDRNVSATKKTGLMLNKLD